MMNMSQAQIRSELLNANPDNPAELPSDNWRSAASANQIDLAVSEKMAELDLADHHSVLFFGSQAQESLTEVSDRMLERVRVKDVGPAGDALSDMVLALRGFDARQVEQDSRPGWFGRLLGKGRDLARVLKRYEQVRDQVEQVAVRLEQQRNQLLTDVESLERLYQANLGYFEQLELYIAAGEQMLNTLNEDIEKVDIEHQAASDSDALSALALRDKRQLRDDLERRVHDLQLTRQVTLQALPGLRLVQENDKSLISKIASTLVNTLPLWRQQLAQALTIERARDAAQTLKAASDLTNDLLRANAENLREANQEARQQVERGVFDIEAIAQANQLLIDTIEDSLRIASEGRARRNESSVQLQRLEQQLHDSLIDAREREHQSNQANQVF